MLISFHSFRAVFVLVLFYLWIFTVADASTLSGSELNPIEQDVPSEEILREESVPQTALSGAGLQHFGLNLFRGGFSNDREDGLNPGYRISVGDRISVRIWGATEFNDDVIVDQQGNIFLPSVGPIAVAGVENRELNTRVSQAVGSVFTDNVKVYTSLNGSQPVAVFVTGYVHSPGRFAGIPSNSALHFLDRAGGIDPQRGSFRSITIMRGDTLLASVDLYNFLLNGVMPNVQFKDGDTIIVGARGAVVETSGEIKNPAIFELKEAEIQGAALEEMVMPYPDATHAGISGTRDGEMYSYYLPLEEFSSIKLRDGDKVHYTSDIQEQLIVVEVEGEYLGPSRFSVPSNTRLKQLLDYIEVDPELSNHNAISLKRRSIAERQKAALEDSLRRLEAKYLTASSQTDKESSIRSNESKMISEFVRRARNVEPNGRLVVARGRELANVLLQSGDVISIPKKSESILLSGEVLVSQALLFTPGNSAKDYIKKSGGFTQQAAKSKLVLVHANGEVTTGENPAVVAGDEIIVLPKVPVKNLQISSTIVDIIYKIAVAASVAVNL